MSQEAIPFSSHDQLAMAIAQGEERKDMHCKPASPVLS